MRHFLTSSSVALGKSRLAFVEVVRELRAVGTEIGLIGSGAFKLEEFGVDMVTWFEG